MAFNYWVEPFTKCMIDKIIAKRLADTAKQAYQTCTLSKKYSVDWILRGIYDAFCGWRALKHISDPWGASGLLAEAYVFNMLTCLDCIFEKLDWDYSSWIDEKVRITHFDYFGGGVDVCKICPPDSHNRWFYLGILGNVREFSLEQLYKLLLDGVDAMLAQDDIINLGLDGDRIDVSFKQLFQKLKQEFQLEAQKAGVSSLKEI